MANQVETRQDIETKIIFRALKDESFKQQLLSNPDVVKAEIEKALGQKVPDDFKVQVLQETQTTAYLILPFVPAVKENLTEAQLEAVDSGVEFDKMTIQLEHRFSNRGTEEKSTESEVNNGEENKVNACQPMLITAMKT